MCTHVAYLSKTKRKYFLNWWMLRCKTIFSIAKEILQKKIICLSCVTHSSFSNRYFYILLEMYLPQYIFDFPYKIGNFYKISACRIVWSIQLVTTLAVLPTFILRCMHNLLKFHVKGVWVLQYCTSIKKTYLRLHIIIIVCVPRVFEEKSIYRSGLDLYRTAQNMHLCRLVWYTT